MKPPGVLVNGRARRASRDRSLPERLRKLVPDEYVHSTGSAEELGAAIERLRKLEVERILLVGGDGTVGGTLTPLVGAFRAAGLPLPAVTLTRGGTINTIARSLEASRPADDALARLLDQAPPRLDSVRPLVQVEPEGAPARLGMIFVSGVAARWLELYYEGDDLGPGAAAALVARIARSALTGTRLARQLFERRRVAISVDGDGLAGVESFTVMGAATVKDIGLGFRPFHSAGSDLERIHFLFTDAGPLRVCLELPTQRLGLRGPVTCLSHHPVRTVELRFASPEAWSVDADLFPPAATLRVSAGPPVRFVSY